MEEYIIETNNLTKKFPGKVAVDHVNMHIKRGDIYGFIGRNGAGKTTAMKLILGLLKPNEGEITLFGSKDLNAQRKKIGSLIETPSLYKNVSAFEIMKRYSILFGGTDEEINEILELVGLADVGNKHAGDFSLGMKQRLGIAIALLGNPEVLILDEPVNGLDPAGIKEIRDTILKLSKERGVTFLISSHLLDELAKVVTTYGIINEGVLVEEVSAEELNKRCAHNLKIKCDDLKAAEKLLKEKKYLNRYEVKDGYIVIYDNIDKSSEINELLVKNKISVSELSINTTGLEDYFIERIGR